MSQPKHTARRVVTSHDAAGKAVILRDEVLPMIDFGGGSHGAMLWRTKAHPVDQTDDSSLGEIEYTVPPHTGSNVCLADFPPGCHRPLHRTQTLDLAIVLSGEIEIELDNKVTTRLKAGDTVVQHGTIHAWSNPTPEWTRILFVLMGAKPIVAGGQTLGLDTSRL